MKTFICLVLIVLFLPGCAYTSWTRMTIKAKKAKAIAGYVPLDIDDGDVLLDRKMHACMFQECTGFHKAKLLLEEKPKKISSD